MTAPSPNPAASDVIDHALRIVTARRIIIHSLVTDKSTKNLGNTKANRTIFGHFAVSHRQRIIYDSVMLIEIDGNTPLTPSILYVSGELYTGGV